MVDPTTGDLFKGPAYPSANDAAQARRWLAWKVGIDLSGVARYADPNEVLRAAIDNYGQSVIAGRAPDGRVETVGQLFERCCAPTQAPRQKRPLRQSMPKRWGRR